MYKTIILVLFLIFSPTVVLANAMPDFGVITAVPDEAKVILNAMQNKRIQRQGVYKYTIGYIKLNQVILVISGAGIVNVAVATTNLINDFHPKCVLFTGTAGGIKPGLRVGDVIVTKKAYLFDAGDPNGVAPSWPDFPPHPIKNIKDPVIFFANNYLVRQSKKILGLDLDAFTRTGKKVPAKIIVGAIATSDHFPNNNNDVMRMRELNIDAVSMEIASMMKVCWIYNQKCIGFRGISDILDLTNPPNKYISWNKQNEVLASDNAGKAVVKFIQNVKFAR